MLLKSSCAMCIAVMHYHNICLNDCNKTESESTTHTDNGINDCYQSVNDNSRIKATVLYLQQLKSKANVWISNKYVKKLLMKVVLLSFSFQHIEYEAFGP